MKHMIRNFLGNQRGAAMIEFLMVMPFMLLMLLGGIELGRFILITQKTEKSAYVLTDIVGQYPTATVATTPPSPDAASQISVTHLNNEVFPLYDRLMSPFGSLDKEQVVFSSVVRQNGQNLIRWAQVSNIDSLATDVTSIVTGQAPKNITHTPGTKCQVATFNADINGLLSAGGNSGAFEQENIIIGEVFFRYQPIIGKLLNITTSTSNWTGTPFSMAPRTISRRIFLHPRNDNLQDLPTTTPVGTGTAAKCSN